MGKKHIKAGMEDDKMIKQLTPYLYFEGNAEEALNFYQGIFGGEKSDVMRFGDAQETTADEFKDKIIHARLQHPAFTIYFSDTHEKHKLKKGDHVSLTLEFETEEAIDKVYQSLSEGGSVYMELQKTFWNAKYAKVTDKFGVCWDLNYQF